MWGEDGYLRPGQDPHGMEKPRTKCSKEEDQRPQGAGLQQAQGGQAVPTPPAPGGQPVHTAL